MNHEAHEEHEASTDPAVQDSDRSQPWQRFTVLDILLLPLAFALGVSLASLILWRSTDTVALVGLGAFLGPVLAGPIVLFVQYAFRGRWQPLSVGEWLWLASAVMMLLLWLGVMFAPFARIAICLAMFFFPLALIILIGQLIGMRRNVPCRWTDICGAAIWVLSGLLICAALLFPMLG